MASWLSTTVSVIAGGVLTMVAAWLADRRLTERDRERRRDERHERLVTRRNDFQRDTLLTLQDTSQKLLRNAGASLHQDIIAYRTTGKWQRQQLPDDLSNDYLQLNTETLLLASRVRDEGVRVLCDKLRSYSANVGLSDNESEAQSQMMAAADTQGALVQRIGEIVRGIDEAD